MRTTERTREPVLDEVRFGQLVRLGQELLDGSRLIIASNRGPVQYTIGPDNALVPQRGAGGVVTALSALRRYVRLTWVACALSEGDRRVARADDKRRTAHAEADQGELAVRFIAVPPAVFQRYYYTIANPLLWFLQHYMWDQAFQPDIDRRVYRAWDHGYYWVNRAFAKAVVEEAQRPDASPFIMLHDYHLYLVAGMIRHRLPRAILQHFIHIPWPDPDYWHLLPPHMRQAIFEGLCANDIVGLQTRRSAQNFLNGCQAYLPDAEVGWQNSTVYWRDREVRVRAYPISIDVESLRETTQAESFRKALERLRPKLVEQTIVRADRLEPSKNIIRGFRAYDVLLRRRGDLRGRVKFLAFLVPSRTSVPEYKRYLEETRKVVAEINERHGTEQWRPIEVFYEHNYTQALAGLALADVVMVNPLIDGMNLVAKEAPTVSQNDAVLILSEGAGAYEQLREGVLGVSPADIEGTVRALETALVMPAGERARRATLLRSEVETNDISMWMFRQLRDLASLVPGFPVPETLRA